MTSFTVNCATTKSESRSGGSVDRCVYVPSQPSDFDVFSLIRRLLNRASNSGRLATVVGKIAPSVAVVQVVPGSCQGSESAIQVPSDFESEPLQ